MLFGCVWSQENETVPFPRQPEVTEYASLIAVVYSMVKQNYVMQVCEILNLKILSKSLLQIIWMIMMILFAGKDCEIT